MRSCGMLVAGPQPRKRLLKDTLVMAWSTPSAVGTVLPIWLPPKSTFKRPKEIRASFTILEVKLWVQLINAIWLNAVTLFGYPAAAAPAPLLAALKLLPRLNRYRPGITS